MLYYYRALCAWRSGEEEKAGQQLELAAQADSYCCFPNRLEDQRVLEWAMEQRPEDGRAAYYLGCLCYDKKQYDRARQLWERSAERLPDFPAAWRNLALVYYNVDKNPQLARQAMERAFALDTQDARVLLELDQLYKKLGMAPQQRLEHLEQYPQTFPKRDDLFVEYITLLNLVSRYAQAHELTMGRKFHPGRGAREKSPSSTPSP